ncbi:MAG TPA: hypothetical protein VF950_23080 [Planctomycetota bacterium]
MKTARPARVLGMTLLELLVAFFVLLMLVGALVSLSTRSLEVWTSGEARKEIYDRAEVVLSALAKDLRNVYVENEVFNNGQRDLPPPALQCDLDRQKNPRLRFVRTGSPSIVRAQAGSPQTVIPPTYYGPTWEVAYVMDPDPEKAILYRGARCYDRRMTGTLLRAVEYERSSDTLFTACFTPVETGVLYVGYDFWTQYTTTWDDAPLRKEASNSKQKVGAERRWDSTRIQDDKFFFHRRRFDRTNPDFVYPEIIRVTATIEHLSADQHGVKVLEAVDERANAIRVTHTRSLPDAPGLVKIGGEWIEYGGKGDSELFKLTRGRRFTSPASHAAQAAVRFGETFTTEVKPAAFREAQEP